MFFGRHLKKLYCELFDSKLPGFTTNLWLIFVIEQKKEFVCFWISDFKVN